MLTARLMALKVLPSPRKRAGDHDQVGVVDAGRAGIGSIAQQRTLDDAVFLCDRGARLLGRDHPLCRKRREVDLNHPRHGRSGGMGCSQRNLRGPGSRLDGCNGLGHGNGRRRRRRRNRRFAGLGRGLLELIESLRGFFNKTHRDVPFNPESAATQLRRQQKHSHRPRCQARKRTALACAPPSARACAAWRPCRERAPR